MIDLPGKLTNTIDKVLRASESIRIEKQSHAVSTEALSLAQETMYPGADEARQNTSPLNFHGWRRSVLARNVSSKNTPNPARVARKVVRVLRGLKREVPKVLRAPRARNLIKIAH